MGLRTRLGSVITTREVTGNSCFLCSPHLCSTVVICLRMEERGVADEDNEKEENSPDHVDEGRTAERGMNLETREMFLEAAQKWTQSTLSPNLKSFYDPLSIDPPACIKEPSARNGSPGVDVRSSPAVAQKKGDSIEQKREWKFSLEGRAEGTAIYFRNSTDLPRSVRNEGGGGYIPGGST